MKNNYIIMVLVALVFAAGGFFAGTKYSQSQRQTFNRTGAQIGQFGQARIGGQTRNGFRPVNGEITAADSKTITVKLTDGGNKIVILSEKTIVNKADTATVADLKVGGIVAVFGQENSDGSVTAQNIQLNPMMRVIPTPTLR